MTSDRKLSLWDRIWRVIVVAVAAALIGPLLALIVEAVFPIGGDSPMAADSELLAILLWPAGLLSMGFSTEPSVSDYAFLILYNIALFLFLFVIPAAIALTLKWRPAFLLILALPIFLEAWGSGYNLHDAFWLPFFPGLLYYIGVALVAMKLVGRLR